MRRLGAFLMALAALGSLLTAAPWGVSAREEGPVAWKDDKAPFGSGFGVGPGRNLANTADKGIPDSFSTKRGMHEKVRWHAELGNHSYGGPVISGGRVYIGTNNFKPRDPKIEGDKGVMMCFDERDGKFLWQIVHDKLGADDQDYSHQGVISTPFVQGDRLWYVSNRCELVCADAVKGKVLWTVDMRKEYGVFPNQASNSSPIVVGSFVYACTSNGVNIGTRKFGTPKAPSLVALDKETGKLGWKFVLPNPVIHGQWSSPSAARVDGKWQVLFAAGDSWVYGLSADKGEVLWKFNLNVKGETPYKPGGSGEQSFPIGVPVVVDGRCYIATGQEPEDGQGPGHLWCIDITKAPRGKDRDLSPAPGDLDPKSPKNKDSGLVWHYGGKLPKPNADERDYDYGRTLTTVCVHDGVVYATELAGYMHALDAKTGEKLWQYDFNESTWCSPYYVDGKVFVGVDSGDLFIFKAGRKKEEPKKISVGGMVKVPPVAANGTLYVNTQAHLFAVK